MYAILFHGENSLAVHFESLLHKINIYCNIPDPQTGEEDATITKHTGKYPHEHEHAYSAKIKFLKHKTY